MTGSIRTLAFVLLAFNAHAAAAEQSSRDLHIRSPESELLAEIAQGARVSPTLRRLVDRIASSDVVVYVMFDRAAVPNTAGHLSLLAAVPGHRYLRISIDRRSLGCQRLAILGHELQHAVEIANAPWVTDHAGVASLYRAIGFRSDNGHDDCYDSRVAIETGRQVQREILAAASAAGSQ